MSDNFSIWHYKSVPFAAVLDDMTGLKKAFRLRNSTPLQADFPSDVVYHMHEDFPNDQLLVDNQVNIDKLAVVSRRLKDVLEGQHVEPVEYLPIGIIDHKGRNTRQEYFIVHPLDPVDCLNRDKSVYQKDTIIEGNMKFVERLVLDETRIPDERRLFRPQGLRNVILVRSDLAKELDRHKFTGLTWLRVSEYPEK